MRARISVFKGRETKLNKAIFWILALSPEPLTIYDICKNVRTQEPFQHTKYSVINRRVRSLEDSGYIEKVGPRRTQAGFEAQLYQLTPRAYLAILLNQIDLDRFIETADKEDIISALGAFTSPE